MTSRSGGSTRYNIGQEALEAVAITVCPTLDEQRKIADFLGQVDARIALLTRKANAVRRYKNEVSRRLFTRELRFRSDDETDFPDWKATRLGDLGTFSGGGTPDTNSGAFWNGDIPWVSSSDVFDDSIDRINLTRHITREALAASATKTVPAGAILIVTRVGVGKVAIAPEDLCTSQDFSNLIPSKDHSDFLAYWLVFNKHRLQSLCQGTSIKGLTTGDLKSLKIDLPHPDEQRKIADFLREIDAKTSVVLAQVKKTRSLKHGLLQQMFV